MDEDKLNECKTKSEGPKVGDYVVVQRQTFMKLHKLTQSGIVNLGKSKVSTDNVVGKPYWTTFRMEPRKNKQAFFDLVECSPDEDQCQLLMKDISSGKDNRNILDDGSSQKLSTDEIIEMRNEGLSSKEIVGNLIENSTTFQEKTEYSQEKYLKKKEKKYFEYVTIRKPTIRLIADIMYREPNAIMGLRSDTLSQLATAVNLHPHGMYIVYESGCQSLAAAAILNNLSSEGRLVLVHPGTNPQKQAILALNLREDDRRLIYVNIYTLLRKLLDRKPSINNVSKDKPTKDATEEETIQIEAASNEKELAEVVKNNATSEEENLSLKGEGSEEALKPEDDKNKIPSSDAIQENRVKNETNNKRKRSEDEEGNSERKKPRHEVDADRAVALLKDKKADGLVIVCKEHPANILKIFLPFVGSSRNFVVYGNMREPLQQLSMDIRKRPDVLYIQLSEMWLRNYQVLENRTHPFVTMSGGGGYLLTGIKVE